MKKHITRYMVIAVLLILLLMLGGYLVIHRSVEIIINDETTQVQTRSITVAGVLQDAGVTLKPQDYVTPAKNRLVGFNQTIVIEQASQITIITPDDRITIHRVDLTPSAWLVEAGIEFQPGDQLLWNAEPVDPNKPLTKADQYVLQFRPAAKLTTLYGDQTITQSTSASSVLKALWQAGIIPATADRVSAPLDGLPSKYPQITIQPARDIYVVFESSIVHGKSGASLVSEVLSEVGIVLQGLDYSIPASDQPVPADGSIQIIRVEEQVQVNETVTPFGTDTTPDPELPMGEQRVIQSGQPGITAVVKRLRLENGREVSSTVEDERVFSEPNNELVGVGTKPIVRTVDTPSGTLEYYQSVEVYATSYSPCNIGTGGCSYTTAYGLPVQQGVIGVIRSWYNAMAGQRVYVPGYGIAVIGDIGGGVPGSHWIDLAYTEEDYIAWHQNVTLYFLTPIPETILWPLP